jgi:hypothetical protein
MKNVLLLTDIPPSVNYSGGIVLDQLCRFLPKGSVYCFLVKELGLNPIISNELNWIKTEMHQKPFEYSGKVLTGIAGESISFVYENIVAKYKIRGLVNKATYFGRSIGAEVLWCVLQGQTMIRLALPVARALDIPLLVQVWDPPFWWLRDRNVNRYTFNQVIQEFENILRNCSGCACASWVMSEDYRKFYGTRAIPFLPSIDLSLVHNPAEKPNNNNYINIGVAGQLYAKREWETLLSLMNDMNWEICGKYVIITFIGRPTDMTVKENSNIILKGWRTQRETIQILSEADLLYCPYWFDKNFEIEAKHSFPSKLITYFAAGRPVVFHGPIYSSPSVFIKNTDTAVLCNTLSKDDLLNCIESLVTSNSLYSFVTKNAYNSLAKYFSINVLRNSFESFLSY